VQIGRQQSRSRSTSAKNAAGAHPDINIAIRPRGAISTAALLVDENHKIARYRYPVELNGPQTVAFRRALDRGVRSG
jgi:hypothetical protein